MFTGIVEELGEVVGLDRRATTAVLSVRGPAVTAGAAAGDSIAVNGVCLTVVERAGDVFTADVMSETLARTALGQLSPGAPVNLERPATVTTRLGGHLVQGHVDGVGQVLARTVDGEVTIELPAALHRYVVSKGSICVDGVSLTVTRVDDESFVVSLIPTTLALTTLGRKGVGEVVNLEVDVIAKYVERLMTR